MAKRKYKIRFSNNEEYDLLGYNPSTRCSAVKEVKGKRNFSMSKAAPSGGGAPTNEGEPIEPTSNIDTSGIKDKAVKAVADLLIKKKINDNDFLNKAQIIAILANIKGESGCSPSYSQFRKEDLILPLPLIYEGLYAWPPARAALMKNKCGKDYKTNLEGQVNYLWEELQSKDYKASVYDQILSTANKEKRDLSVKALKIMCKGFKKETDYPDKKTIDERIENRIKYVDELWKQVKLITNTVEGISGKGTPDFSNVTWKYRKEALYRSHGGWGLKMDTDGPTIGGKSYGSGSHQSQTALSYAGGYIAPDRIPYLVGTGGTLGKLAIVEDHNKNTFTFAIIADTGWGGYQEASLKTAWNLGYSQSQANGNMSAGGKSTKFSVGYFPEITVNLSNCKEPADVNNAIKIAATKAKPKSS